MKNINARIIAITDKLKALSGGRCSLLVVTKTFPASDVKQAIDAGAQNIAESRVQEAITKFAELGNITAKKHFIGHLQTNKAKKVVELFDIIQSLDSLKLAQALNRHAKDAGKIQDCLIEVKVSGEASKTGIAPENALKFYEDCKNFENIKIKGLMTIAPVTDTPEGTRQYFKQAAALFNEIKSRNAEFNILSMGMSADWQIAVEEGATMVRIGSAIFGARDYDKN
jgi:pyridoxal phosphate enzyme (YggS family)